MQAVLEYLRARAEEGACVMVVTHDPGHLQLLGGRAIVLKEGRVLRVVESQSELDRYLRETLYDISIVVEGGADCLQALKKLGG